MNSTQDGVYDKAKAVEELATTLFLLACGGFVGFVVGWFVRTSI